MNYPNMIMTFPAGNGSILGRGYTIDFWFKIDRLNEFCATPNGKIKYYFVGDPHVIYYDASDTTITDKINNSNLGYNLYYRLLSFSSVKVKLTNISQFNWNHVSIHVDLLNRKLRLYTNYNLFSPDFILDNIPNSVDLSFNKIAFCSSSSCISSPSGYLTDIHWGAAFYKNLRISDGINYNPWNALENYSNTYIIYSIIFFI